MGTQKNCSATWLEVLGFMVMGLVSRLSLTNHSDSESFLGVCVPAQLLSHVILFSTPWTIACKAPLSMEFSRQEYWSGLPFLTPGDLPKLGIEPASLMSLIGRRVLYH